MEPLPRTLHSGPTFEQVIDAYMSCRRHKRNSFDQLAFEIDLESNLYDLWQDLCSGSYTIGRSRAFVVTFPKCREIWASGFRDRVVHHLIYNLVCDRFIRGFIYDSYACLPDRGTLFARDRVTGFARSVTRSWSMPGFYLKLDIANFFNSIDHAILLGLLLSKIDEPWLRTLVSMVVLHDPRPAAEMRSSQALFDTVPPHKSFRKAGRGKGLPIGNLTSQFFANVYLDPFDQYVKHKLKAPKYGRYVDDFIVIGTCSEELREMQVAMTAYLRETLQLTVHPTKTVSGRIADGINFAGYIIKPGRCYLRRSSVANCQKRIRAWQAMPDPFCGESLQHIAQSANSTLGLLRHVDGYRQRQSICIAANSLFMYADIENRKWIVRQ